MRAELKREKAGAAKVTWERRNACSQMCSNAEWCPVLHNNKPFYSIFVVSFLIETCLFFAFIGLVWCSGSETLFF